MPKLLDGKGIAVIAGMTLLGGAYGLITGYREAQSPEAMRATVIKSGLPACIQKATAAGGATKEQILQYCTCVVTKVADSYTPDKIKAIGKDPHSVETPAFANRVAPMIESCRDQVLQHAPPGRPL